MKYLTRTIWILSVVSLFTDIASEMLYPIMPIYLKSIGFSVVIIGVLEGIAEATVGLSKGYFGKLSDVSGRRTPFVQLGYTLSALTKPMMAFFTFPFWIFIVRCMDRLGKGIRTASRDALLSDESNLENKGKVFGFHRSMDTLGAAIGPLMALIFLYYYPGQYKSLFIFAFIPGVIAMVASLYLKEKKRDQTNLQVRPSFFSFLNYWKTSPPQYRKLLIGFLAFALFNSSDVFLLLMVKQSGQTDIFVIGVYIFYNLTYALFAYPLGILADNIGLKNIFVLGLILFALVYFGMAITTNLYFYILLFFLYGIYAAATEGISKAWISTISEKSSIATAIGTYSAFQSLCLMFASSVNGILWYYYGAQVAFIITGLVSTLVILYFIIQIKEPKSRYSV